MEGNKDRKLEEGDHEEDQKRSILKCDYANVKVIVGGEKEEKVYWHHRSILASQSGMVDTKLSTSVGVASEKKKEVSIKVTKISFPDISPSQWEKMIRFITDPVAIRDMTVDDAMGLVVLYDKYDFHTGLKLCDKVLSTIFYKNEQEFKSHVMNNLELLDRCVHVVVLSHEKNLKTTLVNGMAWLHKIFYWNYYAECVILTVDHIRQLVPVIACYSDDENYENVQDAIKKRLSGESIDILNPLFPEYFVSQIQLIVSRNTSLKLVNQIKISNCGAPVAGIYDAFNENNDTIYGTCLYYHIIDPAFNLQKNEIGDWVIWKEYDTLFFICNGSRNESLPPKTGWKRIYSADTLNQTNLPIISYFHNNVTTGDITKVEI